MKVQAYSPMKGPLRVFKRIRGLRFYQKVFRTWGPLWTCGMHRERDKKKRFRSVRLVSDCMPDLQGTLEFTQVCEFRCTGSGPESNNLFFFLVLGHQ